MTEDQCRLACKKMEQMKKSGSVFSHYLQCHKYVSLLLAKIVREELPDWFFDEALNFYSFLERRDIIEKAAKSVSFVKENSK